MDGLTERVVKNMVLNWYNGTNDHIPVEDLERMLDPDVCMSYPNTPDPIIGVEAFRKWYADVLVKYFDETHVVEWWNITVQEESAEALVVVRWETRSWPPKDALSRYGAYLSKQRFVIGRHVESGEIVIKEKHVLTFKETSPAYGPYESFHGSQIRNSMIALVCANPLATELFYSKHFGFRRARVYLPGRNQVVVLKTGNIYIQLFPAFAQRPPCLDMAGGQSPYPGGSGAGPLYPGVRKLAFLVDDVEAKIGEMGDEAVITQSMRDGLIPGSKIVWIQDPAGNIIELIEGYYDEADTIDPPEVAQHEIPYWDSALDIAYAVDLARSGDSDNLEKWLSAGGNPNQYDADGWTPLLAAAVRGKADTIKTLLKGPYHKVDLAMRHAPSGALPIHFAGHSGDTATARVLLKAAPEHLDEVWDLNGHTLLLQAVFYGHTDLTRFALEQGADAAITTVRGLAPMELAAQFQNQALMDIIRPYDKPAAEKEAYIQALLRKITPIVPAAEAEVQKRSDELVTMIETGLKEVREDESTLEGNLDRIRNAVESGAIDVNRLGGPLQQPLLVVAVTGNNGDPAIPALARFRKELSDYLLGREADPTLNEKHPMAVNAIIRAAVFNHLDILKAMGAAITPERLEATLNEQPSVNGLTALHDTVLRGTTAGPARIEGYIEQIRWFVQSGARDNIEDHSGRTQRSIAEACPDPERRTLLLKALDKR